MVLNRNPVSSAFCMIGCFVGVAALFIGLNAYFIGTVQILVYTGAIMVLFLFIIMLLDVKAEERKIMHPVTLGGGALAGAAFLAVAWQVLRGFEPGRAGPPELAPEHANDVMRVGQVLFTEFHFPLQMVAVLLLVATVGVVVLSKKELN